MAEHTEQQRTAFAASVAARAAIERANASELTDAERRLWAAVLHHTVCRGRIEDSKATIGQLCKVANIRSDKTARDGLTKLASLGIIEYETRRGKHGGGITLRLITDNQGDLRALAWALAEAEGSDPRQLRHEDWARIRDVASQLAEVGASPADVHQRAARYKVRFAKFGPLTAHGLGMWWSHVDLLETGTPMTTGLPTAESGSPSTTEFNDDEDDETGTPCTTELDTGSDVQTGSQTGNQTGSPCTTDTENTENYRDTADGTDFAIATSVPSAGAVADATRRKRGTCKDCNEEADVERLGNHDFCATCIAHRQLAAYRQTRQ